MDLSIVIPTLNAAATLPATLAAIGSGPEIVIVDGGSAYGPTDGPTDGASDGTAPQVQGACVIRALRGRGTQLAAGIAAASRPWLLLLHADTRLGLGWQAAVAAHMAEAPQAAGYFRFRLDSDDARARRLERMVAWRCRTLALPYGDQGLLLHRDLLASVGGMRPLPLMEDVDLVRRLVRRHGRSCLLPLPADAVTSAARWEREGWSRRSARNLVCLSLWFAGVPPRTIRKVYG